LGGQGPSIFLFFGLIVCQANTCALPPALPLLAMQAYLGLILHNQIEPGDTLWVWDPLVPFFLFASTVLWLCTPPPVDSHTHPHMLNTTMPPTPTLPMWKMQKCASMSRQCHLLALSTSNHVARTWTHIFVSSTLPVHSPNVPIHNTTNQEAREVPKHVKVQGPCPWFLPFMPPNRSGVAWNKQRGP